LPISENYSIQVFDQPIALIDPIFDGYIFNGWYIDEDLTTPYNPTTMPPNDLILWAMFSPISSV
jgi:hypothetical protein